MQRQSIPNRYIKLTALRGVLQAKFGNNFTIEAGIQHVVLPDLWC